VECSEKEGRFNGSKLTNKKEEDCKKYIKSLIYYDNYDIIIVLKKVK